MNSEPILVLVGLTASGKKKLGLRVAERVGAEIISLDSMKIYRGMDIGSAKPSPEDRAKVPFHLLDLLDPGETFSVGQFLSLAAEKVEEIRARGRRVIFLGGTAFYLNCLLNGLIEGVDNDPALRRRLIEWAEREGPEVLHGQLREKDSETADKIHSRDIKRIVRALEVIQITGQTLSWMKENRTRAFIKGPFLVAGIRRDPDRLKDRIAIRTRRMIEQGFVEEVARISSSGGFGPESGKAIGYRQILEYIEGRTNLEEAVEQINTATWRFSRKQMTWYKRFPQIRWFDVEEGDDLEEKAVSVSRYFTDPSSDFSGGPEESGS